MGILHAFSSCVRETFNHGLSPSEVDWGDPKGDPTKHGPNYTSSGCMLMEVDWGGKLRLNYTSCGCMIIEVDWGGKLRANSVVDWGTHETHPNGHNISKVDWGDPGSSSNHMTEFLLSEVDWGDHDPSLNPMDKYSISEVDWRAHDSSYFLYHVYIDLDAKPKDIFTQELRTPTKDIFHPSHSLES